MMIDLYGDLSDEELDEMYDRSRYQQYIKRLQAEVDRLVHRVKVLQSQQAILRQAMVDYRAEAEHQRRERVAAEAREQAALEEARREAALRMWKDCALALDGVRFPENASLGSVWAACSRAIQDLEPSKVKEAE